MAGELQTAIKNLGHFISYDWVRHGSISGQGYDALLTIACAEFEGIRTADLVIVLLPGGRGTHVELGMALALGKKIIIWAPNDVYFQDDQSTCVFYWHPSVQRLSGPIERLTKFLSGFIDNREGL